MYILPNVSKIKTLLSLLFMQYKRLCVFCLPMYFEMIVSICVIYLNVINSVSIFISHHLGLGDDTMVYNDNDNDNDNDNENNFIVMNYIVQ